MAPGENTHREMATLTLKAEREAFSILKDNLEKIFDRYNLPQKLRRHILISADEIVTNIASYAYCDSKVVGDILITVSVTEEPKTVTISFRDSGIPYDPLKNPPPNLDLPLSERKIGGLGIFLTKKLMDRVEYHHDGLFNILTLIKTIE